MASRVTPIILGIAGGTGSGKTTVANVILERGGAGRIGLLAHDAYSRALRALPRAQPHIINFDPPASLETELLVHHLEALRRGQAVEVPIYDFTTHARTNLTRHVEPQLVILVEGILVFAERGLRALFAVKIFVDTDPDVRFIRRLQRDI